MLEVYTEIRFRYECNVLSWLSFDVFTAWILRCSNDWECDNYDVFRDTRVTSGTTFNTEDVFLAKQMFKYKTVYESRLPSFAQAQAFSVETMYAGDPAFVHKVWRYLHPINAIELLAGALALYPF
jgi:hypothetical protein